MSDKKMTLSEELKWRGLVNQTTYKSLSQLDKTKPTFYHGFDASADSQTVGNLAGMMLDRLLMRHGCKAVILAGGATSLIGDPGGKDAERPLQDEKTIAHNVAKAEEQLKRIFTGLDYTLVNNLDWTKNMTVIEFLRDIGKHFSMTPLIQRDYIAKRLGADSSGISYAEFSYTILQGMDYLYLFDNYGVRLQIGGSDQWGNCLSGVDLVRRVRGESVDVLTQALVINKATGKKFGKSEAGAVWLDAKKTSPYDFYQFWLNMDDDGIEDYLKIYTELDKPQIDEIMTKFKQDKSTRLAQKTLAYEVTKLVHGQKEADAQSKLVIFTQDQCQKMTKEDFEKLKYSISTILVGQEAELVPLLVTVGLAKSNTEARHFIKSGAVYVNGVTVSESKRNLDSTDYFHGFAILRRGKNNQVLLKKK